MLHTRKFSNPRSAQATGTFVTRGESGLQRGNFSPDERKLKKVEMLKPEKRLKVAETERKRKGTEESEVLKVKLPHHCN